MQGNAKLFTLQHRLYTYLNTSSNLGSIMNSTSGAQTSDAAAAALNTKVIKYTGSHGICYPYPLRISFHAEIFRKRYYAWCCKGLMYIGTLMV